MGGLKATALPSAHVWRPRRRPLSDGQKIMVFLSLDGETSISIGLRALGLQKTTKNVVLLQMGVT